MVPKIFFHEARRYSTTTVIATQLLTDRVQRMLNIDELIGNASEVVRKRDDLYYAEIQPGVPLYEFLYSHDDSISRDTKLQLQIAIDRAKRINAEEFAACDPVGALGLFDGTDHAQIDNALDFMLLIRDDLRINPCASEQFHESCKFAFPNLEFSKEFPGCFKTFKEGHQQYAGQIVDCFSALNDEWRYENDEDLVAYLRKFSAISKYKTTLEGDGRRKPALTFSFKDTDESVIKILCEPHMKITETDKEGDGEFRFNRIYFSPRPQNGKLFIGHAGKHL
ncbi:hypothetical protein ACSV5G_00180 [Agrobacterium cavarae]|uniref:hypothetical protein n=1 Tax=Agrobacterium cavarae TaxID=2528239 RepID=UPI003FD246FB